MSVCLAMWMPRPVRLRGPVCRPPLLPSGSSSWVTLRNTSAAQTLQGPHPALGHLAPVPWPALPTAPALAKHLPARPRRACLEPCSQPSFLLRTRPLIILEGQTPPPHSTRQQAFWPCCCSLPTEKLSKPLLEI